MIDVIKIAVEESMGNYSRQGGHYSATEILSSPRLVLLRRRYEDQKPDVDDADLPIAAFKGNGIHNELKKGMWNHKRKVDIHDPDLGRKILVEYRLMDKILGRRLSGQPDLVYDGVLYDYKTKKAWSKPYFADQFPKWEGQINIYSHLLREYDIEIREAYIGVIYLDWNERTSFGNPEKYPSSVYEYIPINLWTPSEQYDFIEHKLNSLIRYENIDDDALPYCDSSDTWERPTFQVKKIGATRASKNCTSRKQAEFYRNKYADPSKYLIHEKRGDPLFCTDYCFCREWCNQYKERVGL
jgi:hypothetical protein